MFGIPNRKLRMLRSRFVGIPVLDRPKDLVMLHQAIALRVGLLRELSISAKELGSSGADLVKDIERKLLPLEEELRRVAAEINTRAKRLQERVAQLEAQLANTSAGKVSNPPKSEKPSPLLSNSLSQKLEVREKQENKRGDSAMLSGGR